MNNVHQIGDAYVIDNNIAIIGFTNHVRGVVCFPLLEKNIEIDDSNDFDQIKY